MLRAENNVEATIGEELANERKRPAAGRDCEQRVVVARASHQIIRSLTLIAAEDRFNPR